MPYDPMAPTEKERSNIYFIQWFGLAASIGLLINHFAPLSSGLYQILFAATFAVLLVSTVSTRFDEHFYTLRNEACRWAIAFIALCGIVSAIMAIWDLSHHIGIWSANGDNSASTMHRAAMILPTDLIIILSTIIFFSVVQIKNFRS